MHGVCVGADDHLPNLFLRQHPILNPENIHYIKSIFKGEVLFFFSVFHGLDLPTIDNVHHYDCN